MIKHEDFRHGRSYGNNTCKRTIAKEAKKKKAKQKSGFQAIYRDLEKRRVSKSSSMEHNATTTSPSLDMRTFNVSGIHSMKEG